METVETASNQVIKSSHGHKHLDLDESIKGINEVNSHLKQLILRITGQKDPAAPEEKTLSSEPTLSEVLCSGASEINSIVETSHKLIEELNEILF